MRITVEVWDANALAIYKLHILGKDIFVRGTLSGYTSQDLLYHSQDVNSISASQSIDIYSYNALGNPLALGDNISSLIKIDVFYFKDI